MIKYIMPEKKIAYTRSVVTKRRGNGELRREVWVDEKGRVTRYNLVYIKHDIYQGDNGRVIGYDNAHGFHHRHCFGSVEPVEFVSFEDIEDVFEGDWIALRSKA